MITFIIDQRTMNFFSYTLNIEFFNQFGVKWGQYLLLYLACDAYKRSFAHIFYNCHKHYIVIITWKETCFYYKNHQTYKVINIYWIIKLVDGSRTSNWNKNLLQTLEINPHLLKWLVSFKNLWFICFLKLDTILLLLLIKVA
jgi:hypothetical protein